MPKSSRTTGKQYRHAPYQLTHAANREKLNKTALGKAFVANTVKSSFSRSGRWTEDVEVSGTKSFEGNRLPQILRHLSTQIYWFARLNLNKAEQEVQAMAVNDRIILASNDDSSMEELEKNLTSRVNAYRAKVIHNMQEPYPLHELLVTSLKEKDARATSTVKKLEAVLNNLRLNGDSSAAVLRAAASRIDFFSTLNGSEAEDCHDKLTNDRYKNKIILLTKGGGKLHAEQKLLLALHRSGCKETADVFGKKRPCSGCSLTLRFAKEKLGFDIHYNEHSGGFWNTALPGLVKLASDQSIQDEEDLLTWVHDQTSSWKTYQSQLLNKETPRKDLETRSVQFTGSVGFETGYDTASDSEPE